MKSEDFFEVDAIVGFKYDPKGVELFRVRWKGFSPKDDTWEPKENLLTCEGLVDEFSKRAKQGKEVSGSSKKKAAPKTKLKEEEGIKLGRPKAAKKPVDAVEEKTNEARAPSRRQRKNPPKSNNPPPKKALKKGPEGGEQKDTFWLDFAKGCQPSSCYTADLYSKIKSRRGATKVAPDCSTTGSKSKRSKSSKSHSSVKRSPSTSDNEEVPLSQIAVKPSKPLDDDEESSLPTVPTSPVSIKKEESNDSTKTVEIKQEPTETPICLDDIKKENDNINQVKSLSEHINVYIEEVEEECCVQTSAIKDEPESIEENVNSDPVSETSRMLDEECRIDEDKINDGPEDEDISAGLTLPEILGQDLPLPGEDSMQEEQIPGLEIAAVSQKEPALACQEKLAENDLEDFHLPLFDPIEWQSLKVKFRADQVNLPISFEELLGAVKFGDKLKVIRAVGKGPHHHNLNLVIEGSSLLAMAVSAGLDEIAEVLIQAGADPNLTLAGGKTPLMAAVEKNQTPCVLVLLGMGAILNSQDDDGNTALHMACRLGHLASVDLLLQAGANFGLANKQGLDPFGVGPLDLLRSHISILSANLEFTLDHCSPNMKLLKPLFPLQLYSIKEGPLFIINFPYHLRYKPYQLCLLFLLPTDVNLVHRMRSGPDSAASPVLSVILNDIPQKNISMEGPYIFCLISLVSGNNQIILHTKYLPKSSEKLLVRGYKVAVKVDAPHFSGFQ